MTVELDYLPRPISANAGYRRKVWEELGGFDETYARSAETEFFWRLQLAGHTLVDVPGAVVRYRMRSDVGALLRQMYIWGRESAKLRRDFASRGMPRNLQAGVRSWLRLGRTAPDVLRGPAARLWWSRRGDLPRRPSGRLCPVSRSLPLRLRLLGRAPCPSDAPPRHRALSSMRRSQ